MRYSTWTSVPDAVASRIFRRSPSRSSAWTRLKKSSSVKSMPGSSPSNLKLLGEFQDSPWQCPRSTNLFRRNRLPGSGAPRFFGVLRQRVSGKRIGEHLCDELEMFYDRFRPVSFLPHLSEAQCPKYRASSCQQRKHEGRFRAILTPGIPVTRCFRREYSIFETRR